MGIAFTVIGMCVVYVIIAILVTLMRPPALEQALTCIRSDCFTLHDDDGYYERIIRMKPTMVLKGEKSTVVYVSSQFRPGELRESMHIRVHGFLGPLNIFFTDGLPVRIAGFLVKLEILEDESLSQKRAAQLLNIVRNRLEQGDTQEVFN